MKIELTEKLRLAIVSLKSAKTTAEINKATEQLIETQDQLEKELGVIGMNKIFNQLL